MTSAAEKMRDIDPAYSTALSHVEPAIYHFWRGIVPPPPLVDEDIDLQSNAIFRADQPRVPNRPDQPEALELTRLFQQRFPAWADQMAQAAKSDTNAPSFKPEDRAEIERLTSETLALQQAVSSAQSAHSLQDQHHALRDLLRIRELLPKQKNKNQQQQQNKQQQQQKDQSQPQQQPPPEQKDSQKEEQKEQPKPQPQPPKNVEDLLQRALQREKEHETKKLEQLKSAPMLPDERDW